MRLPLPVLNVILQTQVIHTFGLRLVINKLSTPILICWGYCAKSSAKTQNFPLAFTNQVCAITNMAEGGYASSGWDAITNASWTRNGNGYAVYYIAIGY
jgi:hypothetical protein